MQKNFSLAHCQDSFDKPEKHKIKKLAVFTVSIAFAVGLLIFSRSPAQNIRNSLTLCYTTVIPSVFPFMVISAFLINTGVYRVLGKLLSRPIRWLFGCSESSVCSVILGFLCGYPIGASSAAALYDRGEISKSEFERLLTFVNNPGAAFVVGGIGAGLFNSAEIGKTLYISVILSAIICGVSTRIFYSHSEALPRKSSDDSSISVSGSLTLALSESAINMLNVCACVLFFSVPVGIIKDLIDPLSFPPLAGALLSSFFEISGGVSATSLLTPPLVALMVCAFACSWSGLSVHLQVFSVCRGRNISFAPYLLSKLLQGLLSPILTFIYLRFLSKDSQLSFAPTQSAVTTHPTAQKICLVIFIISLIIILIRKALKVRNLPT